MSFPAFPFLFPFPLGVSRTEWGMFICPPELTHNCLFVCLWLELNAEATQCDLSFLVLTGHETSGAEGGENYFRSLQIQICIVLIVIEILTHVEHDQS